jgi:transcriptional regulator with XRE-family HTH domain
MEGMDRRKEIGRRIFKVRQKLRITQKALGKLLYVKHSQISNYETGESYPSIETVIKLAEIGQVSVQWLIMGDYDDKPLEKVLSPQEMRVICILRQVCANEQEMIVKFAEFIEEQHKKEGT